MADEAQAAVAPRVVAVVVAYNRRDLLRQALDALTAQARTPDAVVVVDNCSSDDSADVAGAHPVQADVVRLPRNTGGAGGFAVGIARAVVDHDADLVWLMDDDTVPRPAALAALLDARERHRGPVALLASRVVWTDGRDHPMNTPRVRPGAGGADRALAAEAGAVPIRSASFVSMLVDAGAARRHGLPVADYFIWNDDFEFSCRLLRDGTGLYVPASVVEHRTATFGATDADPGERFRYEVRNKVWMLGRSRALSPVETVLYAGSTARRWLRTLARSRRRRLLVTVGARGLLEGLRRGPSPHVLTGLGVDETLATFDRLRSDARAAAAGAGGTALQRHGTGPG